MSNSPQQLLLPSRGHQALQSDENDPHANSSRFQGYNGFVDATAANQTHPQTVGTLPVLAHSPKHDLSSSFLQKDLPRQQSFNKASFSSWKALNVMLVSLLIGLGLAIAHHEMNSRLNGQVVDAGGKLSQTWTSRYSTALAFSVKTSFAICVGTAFVQRQWLEILTYRQSIMIDDLDTLSGVLSNFLAIFSIKIWFRHPSLLAAALISWAIPFAAVITPGTLTVEIQPHMWTMNDSFSLPSYKMNAYIHGIADESTVFFQTSQLSKIAFTAATSANIVPISTNATNQTYTLDFLGPALLCSDANETEVIAASLANNNGSPDFYSFAAWAGTPWWSQYISPPDSFFSPMQTSDNSFWVLSMHGDSHIIYSTSDNNFVTTSAELSYPHANLTECRFYNASYNVEFRYINSTQTTIVKNIAYTNPLIFSADCSLETTCSNSPSEADFSYKGIAAAFGSLMAGVVSVSQYGNIPSTSTHYDLLNINWNRSEATAAGLEELFQNITLSLFSEPSLLTEPSQAAQVTIETWQNTYVYNSRNLLLAYGLTFWFSLVCCAVGLHAFFISNGSYRNTFSTFIRAAYLSNLDLSILDEAGDTAADPLPEKIKYQVITVGQPKQCS